MNLKLKRLVRTASSEQYALFDLDQMDPADGMPATIGKLDLHYTSEGVYGTLLLWDGETGELAEEERDAFIYALLDEVSQPMGVPNEYVVEFFTPALDGYSVFHNVGLGEDDEGLPDADEIEDAAAGAAEVRNQGGATQDEARPAVEGKRN